MHIFPKKPTFQKRDYPLINPLIRRHWAKKPYETRTLLRFNLLKQKS